MVYGLENEAYVVNRGPGPVLDLHLSSTVIDTTHMEPLYLDSREDEKVRMYLIIAWAWHQGDLKRNSFVDELTSVVPWYVSIHVNRLLLIIKEHEAFEANVRAAGRLLPINNLCINPVHHGSILDLTLLNLRNQLADNQASVVLSH